MSRFARSLLVAVAFGTLLAAVPPVLRATFAQASVSYLSLAINALTLAVLALSWDILGRTGQLSLAHAAFYGAGAYTVAVLLKTSLASPWLAMAAAGLVGALLALLLGSTTLRLRGIYFAIATLAFTEVLRAAVQRLPTAVAGGAAGLNIAALFRPVFVPGEMQRWEVAFLRNQSYFWLYAALLLLSITASLVLRRPRFRAAFAAIRTNEEVAAVMGVVAWRYKLLAFVVSSALVGLLGALEGFRIGSVNPHETFAVDTTILALVTPIFGGLYTTLGPILGAGVLASIEELLKRTFSSGYLIGYGVVLVLAVLFMPRGLVGLLRGLWGRKRGAA